MRGAGQTALKDCVLIALEQHDTGVGDLVVVEGNAHLPFDVNRVFYIYDIPMGMHRGAHAHKECHQLIVAASGSFTVTLDDGRSTTEVVLNQPNAGLHIPPGIWASEVKFSGGAICLVLASHEYDERDYLRDYIGFRAWKNRQATAS